MFYLIFEFFTVFFKNVIILNVYNIHRKKILQQINVDLVKHISVFTH